MVLAAASFCAQHRKIRDRKQGWLAWCITSGVFDFPNASNTCVLKIKAFTKSTFYATPQKPLWRTLRNISIAIIVLAWISLIAATIAIIVVHPRCKSPPAISWWQKSVVYRVYIRSFQDSDNDGVGDLKGVTSRLEYLKDLGVETISLSPFYEHDQSENEFSVLNHTMIDSHYGTMADFQELVKEIHNHDMRLVVDFIPGTTSKQHMWFTESASSSDQANNYRNYYVWKDGIDVPTNWSILEFWMDNDVDGFFVRNSAYLFVDDDLRNEEPLTNPPTNNPVSHPYYLGLTLQQWTLPYLYSHHSMLIADIRGSTEQSLAYYGRFGRDGVDISLNYGLIPVTVDCNGACVKKHLDSWLTNIPSGQWQTWMVGTEDTSRVMSRTNSSLARALTMLTMFMPGTPVTYYGDEIGMTDVMHTPPNAWSMDQPMRSTMQWSNTTGGGFASNCSSNCSPWIPVNPNYDLTNVEFQEEDPDSDLAFFKNLISARQNPTVLHGDFLYVVTNDNLLSFRREFDGLTNYLVAINFGSGKVKQDFRPSESVTEALVEAVTSSTGSLQLGDTADLSGIELDPLEGVVLSWDYQIKQY
ncbi:LOW QUALITY PROTEIN: amino acid transporter heavy chain SLC3A1-like [Liolophura sinensis]|uniref:LOW QUALITY PROTEIN: amino acid transporter heavy chain SLC3A1-like n=1 Tax=Liolophura sinensis TaxID=3198878 RepID=UPI00315836DA